MKHPATLGYQVNVYQNSGCRKGTVVKITPKRVRIEWDFKPDSQMGQRGLKSGVWFKNENGFIGYNCQYGTPTWGSYLEGQID